MANKFITPAQFRREILRVAFRNARKCKLDRAQRRWLYWAALTQYGF